MATNSALLSTFRESQATWRMRISPLGSAVRTSTPSKSERSGAPPSCSCCATVCVRISSTRFLASFSNSATLQLPMVIRLRNPLLSAPFPAAPVPCRTAPSFSFPAALWLRRKAPAELQDCCQLALGSVQASSSFPRLPASFFRRNPAPQCRRLRRQPTSLPAISRVSFARYLLWHLLPCLRAARRNRLASGRPTAPHRFPFLCCKPFASAVDSTAHPAAHPDTVAPAPQSS